MTIDRRTKFLSIYANLPLPVRNEVVVVIDHEPLTWNIVMLEVENKTQKGEQALDILQKLKIIP